MKRENDDLKAILNPYIKNWKWFALTLFICIVAAFIYFRYATPKYEVQAKLQILQEQGSSSDLSNAIADLNLFTGGNVEVQDEIEIIKSRSYLLEVIEKLGLNISILAKGRVHNTELYLNPPVKVNFLIPDSVVHLTKHRCIIKITSPTTFTYFENDDTPAKTYSFGSTVDSGVGDFVIIPTETNLTPFIDREYLILVTPVSNLASKLKKDIEIISASEESNILSITLQDPVEQKALDIINELIATYNDAAISDKKEIADRTAKFIDDRIADIYGDLSSVDESSVDYRAARGITNVAAQSDVNYTLSASSRQELEAAQLQLNIATGMKNLIDNQQTYDVLPANMASDPTISNATARFNELVLERNRLLKSSNEKNPIIVNIDQQLEGLKRSLQSSLSSQTNNLNLRVNNLSNQLSQINARIYAAPGNEQVLRDIERERQTAEALYLYLLQSREQAQITYASASPKSKVVEYPHGVSPSPVSPKKPIILLASMILGLFIPFSVVYIRELLDNKVHSKIELEKLVGDVPVLAELPKIKKKENNLVRAGERTVLAESLRILRANLDYLIKTKSSSKNGSVIYVTSSVPGEGKTLVASNLAMIYAKANKKVLLIGADIRNPKLYQFYTGKNVDKLGRSLRNKDNKGLTDFLVDESLVKRDIVSSMLVFDQTVDVIFSGKIPPNPSELLMSVRFGELMQELRNDYDYIIVDTAPLMVVSDTLLISEYADQTLFVLRAHETDLKVLEFPLKLHKEGKIKGMSFVVNGVKDANLGYGGRYGYGYGKTTKKWWKF